MSVGGISTSQIDSMLALLRNTAAQAAAPSTRALPADAVSDPSNAPGATSGSATVNFADALKNSLNQVNQVQAEAQKVGNQFAAGDKNLSISAVMIATQKASISLQETVQVRNKIVAAYTDIMNMQI